MVTKSYRKPSALTSSDYTAPLRSERIGSAPRRSWLAKGRYVADIYRDIEAEIPRLRRYARALTRDVTAADDLVQDCLARALAKLHLWERGTDLRAWLFTILHNQHVNHIRRAVREGSAVGLNDNEPLLMRGPHQGKRLELRDLERALARLPEEQRSVILLVGLEGMRYEEVAAVLEVPVGTIRSRLSRGRDALRRLIGIVWDEAAENKMADPAARRRALARFGPLAERSEPAAHRLRVQPGRQSRRLGPIDRPAPAANG
jgi:RNA polymerase sigma-70 factor, ECF subfamily